MWTILACTNIEANNLASESGTKITITMNAVLSFAVKKLMHFAVHSAH